jgi:hypothetical protein
MALAGLNLLSVPDGSGKQVDPFEGNPKAVVVLFVRTDCPISNRYAPEIRRLYDAYASKDIRFWLVYPEASESDSVVKTHVREYGLPDRIVRDPARELVKLSGVHVTPEAAVFTKQDKGYDLIYRGRIDDRYVSLGKERSAPLRRDLATVLDSIVHGKLVKSATTRAVGCAIEPATTGHF